MIKSLYFYIKILFLNYFLYSISFNVLNINPKYLPNFYLITIFFFIIKDISWQTIIIIFLYGIILDISEMGIMGLNSFAFLTIYLFIHKFFKRIYTNYSSSNKSFEPRDVLIIFIFSIFYYILKFVILKLSKHEIYFNFIFLYKSILNTFVSPPLFKIFLYEKR